MHFDPNMQQQIEASFHGAIDHTPEDQKDDLEIFRIVFELFDKNKTGFIPKDDFLKICQGYLSSIHGLQNISSNTDRAEYLLNSLEEIQRENKGADTSQASLRDPDMVSFGEFVTLMWSLDEQRKAGILMQDLDEGPEMYIKQEEINNSTNGQNADYNQQENQDEILNLNIKQNTSIEAEFARRPFGVQ